MNRKRYLRGLVRAEEVGRSMSLEELKTGLWYLSFERRRIDSQQFVELVIEAVAHGLDLEVYNIEGNVFPSTVDLWCLGRALPPVYERSYVLKGLIDYLPESDV